VCLPSAAPGSGLCIGSQITLTTYGISSGTGFQVFTATAAQINIDKTRIQRTNRTTTSSICNLNPSLYPTMELTYVSQSLWYLTNYTDCTLTAASTATENATLCFVFS
jgi:hypothetical protein